LVSTKRHSAPTLRHRLESAFIYDAVFSNLNLVSPFRPTWVAAIEDLHEERVKPTALTLGIS
jgi:hypothetical protein